MLIMAPVHKDKNQNILFSKDFDCLGKQSNKASKNKMSRPFVIVITQLSKNFRSVNLLSKLFEVAMAKQDFGCKKGQI